MDECVHREAEQGMSCRNWGRGSGGHGLDVYECDRQCEVDRGSGGPRHAM